jgi:hypothetical protein
LQRIQSHFKEDFDILASYQGGELRLHNWLSLTSKTLCVLICQLLRCSVKDKNPKLVGNILDMLLLVVDKRQLFFSNGVSKVSSFLLYSCVNALVHPRGQLSVWPPEGSFEFEKAATLSEDLKLLFEGLSEILPRILPVSSGFSQQAINFLYSKRLCIEWGCFNDDVGGPYSIRTSQSTTILPADSVLCAVSNSEDVGHIFNHVWVPFGPARLLLYFFHFLETTVQPILQNCFGNAWTYRFFWACMALVFVVLVVPSALAALALYPSVLIYFYLVHGFGAYTGMEQERTLGKREQNADSSAAVSGENANGPGEETSPNEESHQNSLGNAQSSNENPENTSCRASFLTFLLRPIVAYQDSLKGNQSVSRHMLCLPSMASLKMLKVLLEAPIDVFEAPAVRAAVEGMWSKFRFGFFARFALYVIQLLLFSAFACWCIATNASFSEIGEHSDSIVRASFVGGCVAAGIGCYFLTREFLQCCSCVADEGLKEYIEFWNAAQVCSHSLELASFVMFVSGNDPASTRLAATYAVFGLWISLLYFTKAIRQISFLLEILTTILSDMIPFSFVMIVLIMAVTVALQVLTADLISRTESGDMQSISSFGMLLGFALRTAEGRQDVAGSALEQLAWSVYEQSDLGPMSMDAFVYTIYFCFYFLLLVITVVALNALIALMGSSYERVMEKKLSQRYF